MRCISPAPCATDQTAKSVTPVQDGLIYIERINAPFVALLNGSKGHPEFGNGIKYAVDKGWLELHESGTYVRFTHSGNDLFVASRLSNAVVRPGFDPVRFRVARKL